MIAARQIAFGKAAGSVLPASYIKTDGTAWIDTGFVVPNLGCGFEITMSCPNDITKASWSHVFLGAGSSTTAYSGPTWNFINSLNTVGLNSCLNVAFCVGNRRSLNRPNTDSEQIATALFTDTFNTLTVFSQTSGNVFVPPWYVNGVAYQTPYYQIATTGTNALPSTSIAVFGSHVGTSCVNKITADFKLREVKWFAQDSGETIGHFSAAFNGSEYGLFDNLNNIFIAGQDGTILGAII